MRKFTIMTFVLGLIALVSVQLRAQSADQSPWSKLPEWEDRAPAWSTRQPQIAKWRNGCFMTVRGWIRHSLYRGVGWLLSYQSEEHGG
jgi:hypothetical protein